MSTKELAIQSITDLPENASWEDIQERINFMAGVRKGLEEIDQGKGIPHEEIKKDFLSWTTK